MKFVVTDVTISMTDKKDTKYLVLADIVTDKPEPRVFSAAAFMSNDTGQYLKLEFYPNGQDGFENIRPGDTFELEISDKTEAYEVE